MQVTDTSDGFVAQLNLTETRAFNKVAGLCHKLGKLEDDEHETAVLAGAAETVLNAAIKYGSKVKT